MNDRPNPPANFDPSCTLLVETNPDPDKGASVALTVAICDGYAPGPSWLVTKEGGEQSMVVLMVRPSRVGVPAARRWPPGVLLALVGIAFGIAGGCAALFAALR